MNTYLKLVLLSIDCVIRYRQTFIMALIEAVIGPVIGMSTSRFVTKSPSPYNSNQVYVLKRHVSHFNISHFVSV